MKKIKSYTAFYLLQKTNKKQGLKIHLLNYTYKNFRVCKGYTDKYYRVD